jgi:hypothetical protein
MDNSNNSKITMLNANTLELHYWFNDSSHLMDAVVHNKCEQEFLGILNEIAKSFNTEILVETEPLADGGIRRWFKINLTTKKQRATIITAVITALAVEVIISPIGGSLSEVGKQLVEKMFSDEELKELEKELLKENIKNIKEDTKVKELEQKKIEEEIKSIRYDSGLKIPNLSTNKAIQKRKSNFYETLDKYKKITQVSLIIEDENKNHIEDEVFIQKHKFKEFIIVSNELEPIEDENAIIEIISPVLKKGDFQWRGIYKGESLSFNMKSNEFKTLVQTGNIEFKNGSSIDCFLETKRKMDNNGNERITEYNIIRVNNYFENDTPIETSEGKKHRQKQEAEKMQLKLNFADFE